MHRFTAIAVLVVAMVGCGSESDSAPPGATQGSGAAGAAGGGTAGAGNVGGDGGSAGGLGGGGSAGNGGSGGSSGGGGSAGSGGATPDGVGALVATVLRAQGNNDFFFGGTVSPNAWPIAADYVSCDFAAAIDVAPGPGNQWTLSLEHAPLAATQSCADVVSWTQTPLCTIAGSDKSCSASGVAARVTGPACVRGHAVIAPGNNVGNYPGQGSGGTVSFHCYGASGDGPIHFQGTGSTTVTGAAFFGGNVVRSPNMDRAFWLHTGAPLASCAGVVALPSTPGPSETWHVQVAASTSALANGQNCLDLTYTTTADLCTIGGADKMCHFAPAAVSVPTGGCLQIRASCTGGTCQPGSISPNYALDCSTDGQSPFEAGGPTYQSAGSGSFDAGHELGDGPWGISDANYAFKQFGQQYWIAPPSGLASCGGAFTFQNPIGGTGQFDIGLRVATAGLSSAQGCLDAIYVGSATLCSVAAGQKSCWFPLTAASIPPGACFALDVKSSNGSPVGGAMNNFDWQASCTVP